MECFGSDKARGIYGSENFDNFSEFIKYFTLLFFIVILVDIGIKDH
jgi:hypothetical protein